MRAIVACVYALGITALSIYTFWENFPQRDFSAFYLSVSDYWSTHSLYAPHFNQNLNPPHASLVLFSPFVLLPMAQAAIAWFVFTGILTGVSLALIRQELRLSPVNTLWLTAAVLASAASQHNLDQGQVGAVLMLLGPMAWRSARRHGSSAPWLACLVSIKPPLGLWMLAQNRRDALRTLAIGAIVLALGVVLTGPDNWRDWFAAMNANRSAPVPSNLSLFGVLIRASWATFDGAWPWLVMLWSAASIGIGFVSWRTPRADVDRTWLLWGLAAILISPVGWNYYLLMLAGPLTAWGQRERWPTASRTALLLLMLPTQAIFVLWVLHPMAGSVYSVAGLLLWGAVVRPPVPTRNDLAPS